MDRATNDAFNELQSKLDRATAQLSNAQYRELLEEIEAECEIRRMALDEDQANQG